MTKQAHEKATTTVIVTRRFDAAAERVFDAWLDPAKAALFLFKTPTGQMQRVDIDARVGGTFTIIERRDGKDIEHHGEYLEIERPRRLIFSFGGPGFPATRVTINIDPEGPQECELTLTHDGVWADYADKTNGGWTMILETLDKALNA